MKGGEAGSDGNEGQPPAPCRSDCDNPSGDYFWLLFSRRQAFSSSPRLSLQASRIFSRRARRSFSAASHFAASFSCAHICFTMHASCSAPRLPSQAARALLTSLFFLSTRCSHALGSFDCAHICFSMHSRCSAPVFPWQACSACVRAAFILSRRSSQALGSLACEQSKRAPSPFGAWA